MTVDLLLIGSYPPPQGGCSVHVQRLAKVMKDEYRVEVLDLYGQGACESGDIKVYRPEGNFLKRGAHALNILNELKFGIVHFHVSAMRRFVFLGLILIAFIKTNISIVLTIHSGSLVENYQSSNHLWKILFRILIRRFDIIVAVNKQQKKLLEECGINTNKIALIPAYLPPIPESTDTTHNILKNTNLTDRKLLLLSGYGVPLYGYEKILKVLEQDTKLMERLHVIICTYNTFDDSYMEEIERRASLLSSAKIVRNLTPEEFAFLLSSADIYVRATDRDGDAVAIREAGYFGLQVIASDCVERPNGVQLFNRNSTTSLAQALNNVMKNSYTGLLSKENASGYGTLLRQLYRDLIDNNPIN